LNRTHYLATIATVNNTAPNIDVLAGQVADSRTLVASDMKRVDQLIRHKLESDVVLINQMGAYIVNSGGKRMRPQVVLLAAAAAGYEGDKHINLAAIIEFIHTATLLHDDVVDESVLRRGQDTANSVWGNEAAVLVGDFLYSRSFEMMVEVGEFRVMEILASTTNRIAEGEVMQLLNVQELPFRSPMMCSTTPVMQRSWVRTLVMIWLKASPHCRLSTRCRGVMMIKSLCLQQLFVMVV